MRHLSSSPGLLALALGAASLCQAQSPRFLTRQDYSVMSPFSAAVGDFNGDGKTDVIAGTAANYVRVFPGMGGGLLGQGIDTATGLISGEPFYVQAADIDSDGKLDVDIVASGGSVYQHLVLLGKGDGSFRPLPISDFPNTMLGEQSLADFDGDGRLDVVIPGNSVQPAGPNKGMYFLRGHGDGTFDEPALFDSAGCNASSPGDFNGDDRPDVAAACDDGVRIYLGKGDGSFHAPIITGFPNRPYHIAVADLNGDGIPDLVVSEVNASALWVLLGTGDGTFPSRTRYTPLGTGIAGIRIGDVNGDGKLDVVTSFGALTRSVGTWLGNGDGTLQQPVTTVSAESTFDFALGSLRKPGTLDLIATATLCNCISVHLNSGTGKFQDNIVVNLGLTVNSMLKYDFNRDGRPDLLISSLQGLTLLYGTGKPAVPFRVGWRQGLSDGSAYAVVGDFNNDGLLDIASASWSGTLLRVFLGNAAGGFTQSYTTTRPYGSVGKITTGDFNGDGKLDVATPMVEIYAGKGDGTLAQPISVSLGLNTVHSFVAGEEMNGDGRDDIIMNYQHFTSTGFVVLLSKPGGFQPPIFTLLPGSNQGFVDGQLVDINKDGIKDLVGVGSTDFYAYLGAPGGTFQLSYHLVSLGGLPNLGSPKNLTTGDFNGDGSLDVAIPSTVTNSVAVLLGNSTGTFIYDSNWGAGGGPFWAAAGNFTDSTRPGYDDLVVLNQDGTLTLLLNITGK